MNRAEVRLPWQNGLQKQQHEVGIGERDNQRKAKVKVPMAQISRKGIKKEKGCTPVVLESHPMTKGRAPAVAGSRVLSVSESNLWSTRGGGE